MSSYFEKILETTSSQAEENTVVYWFRIHFDETIDISDEAQLVVFCRIADEETSQMSSITGSV